MHLYITRHGKANPDSKSGRDEDRELKPRGVRQANFLGERLAALDLPPTLVLTSGLVRAEQTADGVCTHLDVARRQEQVLSLGHAPSDVVEVIEVIRKTTPEARVMLVGHNPQLEYLVGVLLEGPGGQPYHMKTGTCVMLDCTKPSKSGSLLGAAVLVEAFRLDD